MLGIVTQARRVRARITSLVQLNLELAKVEGKQKAVALGIALGLAGLAAVLLLYAIGFLFATAAVALNEELALWASLLIVAGVILAIRGDRRSRGDAIREEGLAAHRRRSTRRSER